MSVPKVTLTTKSGPVVIEPLNAEFLKVGTIPVHMECSLIAGARESLSIGIFPDKIKINGKETDDCRFIVGALMKFAESMVANTPVRLKHKPTDGSESLSIEIFSEKIKVNGEETSDCKFIVNAFMKFAEKTEIKWNRVNIKGKRVCRVVR